MDSKKLTKWALRPKNKRILYPFAVPSTPTMVKNELGVNKFNLKPFLKRGLIECLNPNGHKGRLYVLTDRAKKLLGKPVSTEKKNGDFDLIGWVFGSPKQRYVVLKTLSLNSMKRTSEEIRIKASNLNPCLSRISTKNILNELLDKDLIHTEIGTDRRRYYWINSEGRLIANYLP